MDGYASQKDEKLYHQVTYYRKKLEKDPSLCRSELMKYGFKKMFGSLLIPSSSPPTTPERTTTTTESSSSSTPSPSPTTTTNHVSPGSPPESCRSEVPTVTPSTVREKENKTKTSEKPIETEKMKPTHKNETKKKCKYIKLAFLSGP